MSRSALFTVDETLGMVLDGGLEVLDSGDEDEIQEDPEFPLPREAEEESNSSSESELSSSEEGIQAPQNTIIAN